MLVKVGIDIEEFEGTAVGAKFVDGDGLSVILAKYLQ
jgi:hypothetical protein